MLSHKQKKFIKTNRKRLNPIDIAKELKISKEEVNEYIKNQWPEKDKNNKATFSLFQFLQRSWIYIIGLVLLVLCVYFNSLQGGFLSDDVPIIKENKAIGQLSYTFERPYTFLRTFFYYVLFHLFNLNTFPYHLLNVFFHIGCVVTIFYLVSLLHNKKIAVIASSIFAVHPVLTEGVSWISGGTYPQYTFFLLASLLCFILYIQKNKYYVWSIIFYLFSLLSSEKAIVYPVILIIYLFVFSNIRSYWKRLIPFFILSIVWVLIYLVLLKSRMASHSLNFGNTGYINPVLLPIVAISNYLQLYFWPVRLSFFHSEFVLNSSLYLTSLFIFCLYILSLIISFFKDRRIFFWLAFFIISLGITLLPLQISWIVAERYAYLGMVGLTISVSILFDRLFSSKLIYVCCVVLVLVLGIRTVMRNVDWQNDLNLWNATLKTAPSNPVAHSSLGMYYKSVGNYSKAAEEFKTAIRLNPQYAEGYYNLGDLYRLAGNAKQALSFYQKSVQLNPGLWQGYQALGAVYYEQKKYSEAIKSTLNALSLQPNNVDLYINVGIMYFENGQKKESQKAFATAVKIEPNNQRAVAGYQKVMQGQ